MDTLAEAFAGSRELFEGLYLEQHWDWSRRYPVLRFDFSGGVLADRALLDATLQDQLRLNGERHGLPWREAPAHIGLARLVRDLRQIAGQPVVVLIDEYDKPILDNLATPEQARIMREGLRNFCSVIKSLDAHLKFVLLTGVSKFSKVSLFSGLNNRKDITLDSRSATLCGYTHGDGRHLRRLAGRGGSRRSSALVQRLQLPGGAGLQPLRYSALSRQPRIQALLVRDRHTRLSD